MLGAGRGNPRAIFMNDVVDRDISHPRPSISPQKQRQQEQESMYGSEFGHILVQTHFVNTSWQSST